MCVEECREGVQGDCQVDFRAAEKCQPTPPCLVVEAGRAAGMHDLRLGRSCDTEVIAGQRNIPDGPIKTFTLRGIKDSPPFHHDGRLLTLGDTVEFYNLVLSLKLTDDEKKSLVTFLRCL